MQSLIPLLLVGFVVYLVFFRKGGMGCCGGHGNHEAERQRKIDSEGPSHKTGRKIIDLNKDEYTIK